MADLRHQLAQPTPLRLIDAVADGANQIDGVTYAALSPVTAGQRCQLLKQGDAPPIILGPLDTYPLLYNPGGVRAFWSIASAGTTDTNGDLVVTATWLSAITGGYGAQPIAANNNRYCTVHTVSGNTFTIRFRSAPTGAVIASTAVDYTAWAIGPPA